MVNRLHEPAAYSSLAREIEQLAALLPAQGPITSFAMLNPLEGMESEPFHRGAEHGAKLNGCSAYYPEEKYRQLLAAGRISPEQLAHQLRQELGERSDELVCLHTTRHHLRQTLLLHAFPTGAADELSWVMAESGALDRLNHGLTETDRNRWRLEVKDWVLRDGLLGRTPLPDLLDAVSECGLSSIETWSDEDWEGAGLRLLWAITLHGVSVAGAAGYHSASVIRHRNALLARTGRDSDLLVLETMGPFCAAFADQGLATWKMPGRVAGFLQCFAALHGEAICTAWGGQSDVARALDRVRQGEVDATALIEESLTALGITAEERTDFLTASLLAFRGWAGVLWQMESRGDRFPHSAPTGTLQEYLAVQLLLERWAIRTIAQDHPGDAIDLANLRTPVTDDEHRRPEQRAYKIFQLAQVLGWNLAELAQQRPEEWTRLLRELASFSSTSRRRAFHFAYERQYIDRALDAFATRMSGPLASVTEPSFQAIFCIDAREESFRRHLEEIDPSVETFGNAGFFNIPIYYRGAADAYYTALCPVVVRPKHWVTEEVALTLEEEHRRRAQIRKVLGNVSLGLHRGSQGLTSGAILSAGLGVLASVPLITRILFPRLSSRLRRTVDHFVSPPPVTRLRLERTTAEPGPEGNSIGLNVAEMTAMAERALRDIGLTRSFAPLVFILGHGSACLNNPHKSTYDCGACTGNLGGPNARAMAMILNDARVRAELRQQFGVEIPASTVFIGGLHNTGDDTLTYFDLDLLPAAAMDRFRQARATLERGCQRNAHERCRRFYSAPLNISPAAAHRLVEERIEDLSQTRPEYGNCTNAICFVGRRGKVRGMYLDRRSFLMSYDHFQDDDQGTILGRILAAVVPVCSGINLQYTFSAIDPHGWGAGTKLPHNITSLVGVMDGAASDLRSGLPWQSVDIHEPMRLLFLMETTPERLEQIMGRLPAVDRILRNQWAYLALVDPCTGQVREYRPTADGTAELQSQFHHRPPSSDLPRVASSAEWYGGHREHLPFAWIEPVNAPQSTGPSAGVR